jgi:hypothetical protein
MKFKSSWEIIGDIILIFIAFLGALFILGFIFGILGAIFG